LIAAQLVHVGDASAAPGRELPAELKGIGGIAELL
jgi:hypothetical protein